LLERTANPQTSTEVSIGHVVDSSTVPPTAKFVKAAIEFALGVSPPVSVGPVSTGITGDLAPVRSGSVSVAIGACCPRRALRFPTLIHSPWSAACSWRWAIDAAPSIATRCVSLGEIAMLRVHLEEIERDDRAFTKRETTFEPPMRPQITGERLGEHDHSEIEKGFQIGTP
jgi:hypothetical protein